MKVILFMFLFILFSFFSIKFILKRKKNIIRKKGKRGESLVASILGETEDGVKQVFNDYRFYSYGKATQIDHILVNKNGVFVIETKNYSGQIYGNKNQQQWLQIMAYGHTRNYFYNPVKQNNSHIYKLSKILPKNIKLISLVVFIKANIDNVDADNVYKINELKEVLNTETNVNLTAQQINYVANILKRNENNLITNEEIVEDINKLLDDLDNDICPRCGGSLVLREGRFGKFYGCSNYPKCDFKKKI